MRRYRLTLMGFCAATLVFSSMTPVEAAVPADGDVYYEFTYTPIEEGVSIPESSSKEKIAREVPGLGAGGFEYDDVTYEECAKHGNSGTKAHWVKNHFAFCRRGGGQIVGRSRKDNTPVGTLTYIETILGHGYQGQRSVSFDQRFDSLKTTGSLNHGDTFLVNQWRVGNKDGAILHKNQRHSGVMQLTGFRGEKGSKNEDPSIKSWKADKDEHLGFEEDEGVGTGKDKVHGFDFVPATLFIDKNSKNIVLDEPRISMRFDSASYLSYKKGSIFTDVRASITYDRKDPEVNETATHIYDAQSNPNNTYPKKPGKQIPGATTTSPLHRIFYDKDKRKDNRDRAISECKKVDPDYASKGKDCDEYPFSSTNEGASTPGDNFSARALDSGDNQKAGTRLGAWFSNDRIIDGDAFYVKIK
ncbi:NucA/NucB deoxyribonuclease domain-containing protein [Streptomyces netropsis]|uniref:NucA/NucB deoxyribonuclease domain-containing protein n=1 Tax=Streptomyces netropsis TaxID=55404 RepID=UPI0037B0F4B5